MHSSAGEIRDTQQEDIALVNAHIVDVNLDDS